jgi:serine/threonine protein kinase
VSTETPIGEGGYAKVVRRGEFAVKRIPWIHLESAIREVIFIKSLSHANIISLTSVETEPENILLTMKYYPTVLSGYKVRGISDVVSIAYGLISAVSYLHSERIIHSDIKCDNILIEPGTAPWPILCDFGISLRAEERRHVGSVCTVTYRAPEVDFDSSCTLHSPGIDIWSCGVVMFRVITGRSMYKYINDCEDSSVYAAGFFDTAGIDRISRLKNLRKLRFVDVLARIMTKLGADEHSPIYKCGIAETLALMLQPTQRPSAKVLHRILRQIVRQWYPEILPTTRKYHAHGRPSVSIRGSSLTIDELSCVVNVPMDVLCSCSLDCLGYAETLYVRIGYCKLEYALACIYIASATYCDSDTLRAILTVMDLSQVRKYVVAVLRAL